VENFDGDLELKRLDLTWSGQVDSVDLTAATLGFNLSLIGKIKCIKFKTKVKD